MANLPHCPRLSPRAHHFPRFSRHNSFGDLRKSASGFQDLTPSLADHSMPMAIDDDEDEEVDATICLNPEHDIEIEHKAEVEAIIEPGTGVEAKAELVTKLEAEKCSLVHIEDDVAPQVTVFEPPTTPHQYDSVVLLIFRQLLGGNAGIAAALLLTTIGLPLLAHHLEVPVLMLFTSLMLAGLAKYCLSNAMFWYNHMRPSTGIEDVADDESKTKRPFLAHRVGMRPHAQRKGKTVWYPKLSEEESRQRAFAPYGIEVVTYFCDLFTWALEYKVRAFCRAVCCDLGLGQYTTTHIGAEDVYSFVLNTSVACFIDKDDNGKVKVYETNIAHPDGHMVYVYKVVGELDHENQRHIRTTIQWDKDDSKVTIVEDATEAVQLYGQIAVGKSHVHVHWWGNGVKELEGKWSMAQLSSDITQGFNTAAQFTAGPFVFGTSDPEKMRMLLLPNVTTEGLPVHSNMGDISENSATHRMIKACRGALKNGPGKHLGTLEIEAILQASVMHAADHYFTDKLMPVKCYSHLFEADYTPFRLTVIPGCFYRTRKLLCRQYMDKDPICAAIYECCREVDAFFADYFLTVGIAA